MLVFPGGIAEFEGTLMSRYYDALCSVTGAHTMENYSVFGTIL